MAIECHTIHPKYTSFKTNDRKLMSRREKALRFFAIESDLTEKDTTNLAVVFCHRVSDEINRSYLLNDTGIERFC